MMRNIRIVSYDPAWKEKYRALAAEIEGILGETVVAVHHIGSTSVPGLSAKPTIDILVEANDVEEVDRRNDGMSAAGYHPKGEFGIPGRRFFPKGTDEDRIAHVHLFPAGHERVRDHLEFRDYLIAHPKEAEKYGRLKEKLADQFPHDIEGYMAGKDSFIGERIRRAAAWARAGGNERSSPSTGRKE